jgi:hypothetical protein
MAYLKPQSPIKFNENHIYPLTTADQVILSNGSRLEKNGSIEADKLKNAMAISLSGDVTGTANFDGSNGITIDTTVSASKFFTVTLSKNGWSTSAPYTQTVSMNGIKASDNPVVDINMASATTSNSSDLIAAWGLVGRIATNNNSITAYCYEEKPTVDISVNLMVVK